MDSLLHDLRYSLRSLLRRPAFTLVAVATLALGIGATTAIWSVVNGVLLRSLPYDGADRIVSIWQTSRQTPGGDVGGSVSPVAITDWREQAKSFESVALYTPASVVLTGLGEAEVVRGGVVTPDFFAVFRASPILGREFTPEEDRASGPDVIVVSHGFWRERLGGRSDVLGTTIAISGRPRQIVGVAPPGFDFPNGARLWFPVQNDPENCGRDCVYLNGIARLAPGVTVAAARDEMSRVASFLEQTYPESNTDAGLAVSTLQDHVVGEVRDALVVLLLAVLTVLLIGCANVANLLLARGTSRGDEVAIRSALGAGRARIARQLLTESVVLALLGGVAGIGLAYAGVAALHRFAPDLPRLDEVTVEASTLLFALGLAALTALVFGLAPALALVRSPLAAMLGQGRRGDGGDRRRSAGRAALLVAEVGLSLMLLLGAGLLLRSFARMQAVEPGYRIDDLAHFGLSLPPSRYPTHEQALQTLVEIERELEAQPAVLGVARVRGMPLDSGETVTSFARPDLPPPPPGQSPTAIYVVAAHDLFDLIEMPMVEGRAFAPSDRVGSVPVAIVNRAAAERFWPGESPVGKQIDGLLSLGIPDQGPRTIVGVVSAARTRALVQEPAPEIYVPFDQVASRYATFVVRTAGGVGVVQEAARRIVRARDPLLPLMAPGTLSDLASAQLARPRFYLALLALFAVLAVVLAAVGIYGVVAYVVSRRTREIGIRMALGATPGSVVALVVKQGIGPAILGVVLGLAGALGAGRLISRLLYGVEPSDPLSMVAATALLLLVVLAACSLPARRAARIPPASALRAD